MSDNKDTAIIEIARILTSKVSENTPDPRDTVPPMRDVSAPPCDSLWRNGDLEGSGEPDGTYLVVCDKAGGSMDYYAIIGITNGSTFTSGVKRYCRLDDLS